MQLRGKTRSFLEQIKLVFSAKLEVRITRFKAWQPNHLGMLHPENFVVSALFGHLQQFRKLIFQPFLIIFWVGLKTSQQHWVIYILYLKCFSESYFFYSVLTIFSFDLQQELIKKICGENGVLVTSFSGMRQHQDHLLAQRFDYVILDEGHKIRNPDAEITLACKQVTSFQFTF